MTEANKFKYSTIAFPAIGTGSLGFPHDVVAEEMFTAISLYEHLNPQSSITEVTFVVFPGASSKLLPGVLHGMHPVVFPVDNDIAEVSIVLVH